MAVDPRHLRNFLAIADHGSFVSAADHLGMSQPALSNSIALLERSLGVKVLDRNRRGSSLNAYGEILVRRARALQSLLSDVEAEVRLKTQGVAGPLAIGATPSVLPRYIPDALKFFLADGQPLDLTVIDGVDDILMPALRSGRIELIVGPVGSIFAAPDDIVEEVLIDDPFSVAVGPHHRWAGKKSLSLAEIANEPWVLPHIGSSYRLHVEAFFRSQNVPWPRDCIATNSLPLLEAIVRSSNRMTIISRLQAKSKAGRDGLRSIPLVGAGTRTIGIKFRRGHKLSPLGERFVDALRQAAVAWMDDHAEN